MAKKLKKIPSDLVSYIQIETEAIRDFNDKQMISSYCLGKLDLVNWYLELLDTGSKKYIVPQSKSYLETVRDQLNECRDYVVESGWTFTDREKAELLFRSNCMNDLPLEAYYLRLRDLRDKTPDRELGAELTAYLECLGQSVQIFGENHGRNSIYVLKIQDDGESGWYQTGTFFDWETALAQGKKTKVPFQIEKYPVGDMDLDGACRHVSTADFYFDKYGEAVSFWSREISEHCDDNRHF